MRLVTRPVAQAGAGEVCTGGHASASPPIEPDYDAAMPEWDRAMRELAGLPPPPRPAQAKAPPE